MEFKLPKRVKVSNKSTYGKVLNIAGSDYMPGAAYLSSVSALKIGCGYCYLCSSERVISSVSAQTQNVVFVPVSKLQETLQISDVVEIGCGITQEEYGVEIFNKFLESSDKSVPVVIDADGLNIISKDPEKFIDKGFEKLVFTPHPKEAARLLNSDDVSKDISKSAKLISEKYNCVTVLKSHESVVYSPDGRIYKNTTGNNSMAKAGSGDVLTGIISGLIAQGMDIYEAACLGVYLHGLSGDLAKEKLTQYCVMADDLISFLPEAVKLCLN